MSKHDDDTCPHLVRASLLEAENARLKAFNDEAQAHIAKEERKSRERLDMEQAKNTRLQAEVERLDSLCKQLGKQHSDISCENIMLRKAGDAMYAVIYGFNWLAFNKDITNTLKAWNAAKEGKPSEQKSPSFIEDLGNGVEKHDLLFRYPAKEGKPSV